MVGSSSHAQLVVAAVAAFASLVSVGCEPDDRLVPFGLAPREDDTPREPAPDEPSTFEPRATGDRPRGERSADVAGARLSLPELEIGSLLELDVDGDRDLDAIVVARSDTAASLQLATRDGDELGVDTLATVALPEGCTAGAARIEQPEERTVLARLAHACPHGPSETIWALEVARRPRLRETIRVLPPAEGGAPVTITTAVRDLDGDARSDLEALVSVAGGAPVPLAWLDRPGGFGLTRAEPAATLRRLLDEAEARLAASPDEAESKALEALADYDALCAERPGAAPARPERAQPRIAIGGSAGIQCELDDLPVRANAVAIAARVRNGELLAALELEARARSWPGFEAAARSLVAPAWAAAATPDGLTARSVLTTEPLGGRAEMLASLFFADERAVVVRGRTTRRVTLDDPPAVEPALDPGPPIRDATGTLAVLDVQDRCGESVATIVRAASATHPFEGAPPLSRPVIASELRAGVACEGFVPTAPPFGFVVLGYAPQGLVAARLAEVRVVPLTVSAQPAGDPQTLPSGTPLPAPVQGGLVTRDGSVYVLPSPYGLLRFERATGGVMLLRPREWTGDAAVHAAAIAPSGRRAAVHRGDAVWVLDF